MPLSKVNKTTGDLSGVAGSPTSASAVGYDNTQSGLPASNVQQAIDLAPRIFYGTQAEWDDLTTEAKKKYDYAAFGDDASSPFDFNWLRGKTVNFLGDSITRGSWYQDGQWQGYMDNPYPSIIASLLGCTSNNYGVSGSPIVHTSGGTGCVDRVGDMPSADMNVLFAGVNDLTGGTLGDKESTANTTVYGALKLIAQAFIANNPSAINVFISPLMSTITTGAISYDAIRDAIEYVAHQYGFIFIDASVEAPMLQPNNATLDVQWLNGDTCHPNPDYHVILGSWLARKFVAYDGSSSIDHAATQPSPRILSEIRTSDYKDDYYLKITFDSVTQSSDWDLDLVFSYGGHIILTGNPYYDKNFSHGQTVVTIRALALGRQSWEEPNKSFVSAVYVAENAIYIEFNLAVAILPVLTSKTDISLDWVLKTSYTYDSTTDRIESIQVVKTSVNSALSVLSNESLSIQEKQAWTTSTAANLSKSLSGSSSLSFNAPITGKYLVLVHNIPVTITGTPVGVLNIDVIGDLNTWSHTIWRGARAGSWTISGSFIREFNAGQHTILVRGINRDGAIEAEVDMSNCYLELTIIAL